MSTPKGTVHARTVRDDAAEYALIDKRVRALNADRAMQNGQMRSAFERQGYFEDVAVSERSPRLVLVAPALRVHPANETVLKYLAPEVEWELVALGEQWRRELKVVFRKRGGA